MSWIGYQTHALPELYTVIVYLGSDPAGLLKPYEVQQNKCNPNSNISPDCVNSLTSENEKSVCVTQHHFQGFLGGTTLQLGHTLKHSVFKQSVCNGKSIKTAFPSSSVSALFHNFKFSASLKQIKHRRKQEITPRGENKKWAWHA